MLTDREALRTFLTELINRVYLLAYMQQIVVGVVAALGVVTALLISVLQRKRELGLLLAVGATPAQVLRSVLAEAVLMGAFGTALGVLIGIPLEWYVLKVVLLDESGLRVRRGAAVAAGGGHRRRGDADGDDRGGRPRAARRPHADPGGAAVRVEGVYGAGVLAEGSGGSAGETMCCPVTMAVANSTSACSSRRNERRVRAGDQSLTDWVSSIWWWLG